MKLGFRKGVTLTEVAVTIATSAIVIISVGVAMVDGQKGWNRMYTRRTSGPATDAYLARRTFDTVVRKASKEKFLTADDGSWLEVYYYTDLTSEKPDRYARFAHTDNSLSIEYGVIDPRRTLSTQTVCTNVSACAFKRTGRSAQMILTLDDGSQTANVTSSAVMHNQ